MNTLHASAVLALLVAAVATPSPGPLHASSAILRCQSSDGTLVYTDKACSAFGAKAAPIPGQVLVNIAREQALERRVSGVDAMQPAPTTTTSTTGTAITRRDAAEGCARSPQQLEGDVRGSFALGDVNRLAESYYWVGMGSRQGAQTLDRLQRLLDKPVVDSHYFSAQIATAGGSWQDAAATLGADGGMLQLVLGDDGTPSVVDFAVHRYAGCYFVRF